VQIETGKYKKKIDAKFSIHFLIDVFPLSDVAIIKISLKYDTLENGNRFGN